MPDIHIRTFLRNLCADSAEVVHKLSKPSKNGGGDYYQASRLAITNVAFDGAVYDQAYGRIAKIKNDAEREHNAAIFKAFYAWWVEHKGEVSKAPHGYLFGPKSKLRVRVLPDMMIKRGKQREIVLLWNYSIAAPKWVAGLGVFIMRKVLAPIGYADCAFVVHDLRAARRYSSGSIPAQADELLDMEMARQEAAASATTKASKGPKPRP